MRKGLTALKKGNSIIFFYTGHKHTGKIVKIWGKIQAKFRQNTGKIFKIGGKIQAKFMQNTGKIFKIGKKKKETKPTSELRAAGSGFGK